MAWAAKRDTKRKEDLAYCLLGIFDVTMPMIYGEGGDQAFFRLQEQIMRKTRDHSILAWGLAREDEDSKGKSSQPIPGRVLAAAPSDFAHSGQIVSRDQLTTSLNSFDISGGSLRIRLPLLSSTSGETFGLLNCGPEHDTEKVVGIPLSEVAAGSSGDYIRPQGCHSVLQLITTRSTQARLIQIKNDIPITQSADIDQFYWLYDADEFAELDLHLVDTLEEQKELIGEIADINGKVQEKTKQLRQIRRERKTVENELKRLEEKKRAIVEAERTAVQDVHHLTATQKYLEEKRGPSITQFIEMRLREILERDANAT
ncbi:hypothetical protein F4803DRAFT_576280 [Xylaria telfairii]|nr:hypothetical protein F4803DRAFT_576280 [Xylaria telfairii]